MKTLKADHRVLTNGAKYSFLADNYLSGVTTLTLINGSDFTTDDFVLIGEWGSEVSEIKQITVSGNDLTVSATKFAHPQDTRVTIIKYNQVKFYHTTTTTFSSSSQIGSTLDIQCDSNYTRAYDTSNTTGYGWFCFYNSVTATTSTNSNAIPYAGFSYNSVKKILDNFYSLLNNRESKLISHQDAMTWLNEGYAIARNELNLVNPDYTVATAQSISLVADTAEYDLESNCNKIISVYDADNKFYLGKVDINKVDFQNDWGNTAFLKYYVRGTQIGFSPTPDSSGTIYVRYKTNSSTLSSYYDSVDLPNNNYYCLVDYMMYRAAPKLKRGDAATYYNAFNVGIQRMKVTSHKNDGEPDSWGISPESNV